MAQMAKYLPTMQETQIQSLGWEDLEKEMASHSSILPGKSYGRRKNLVGYSPWGHKELDTTEQLHFTITYFIYAMLSHFSRVRHCATP